MPETPEPDWNGVLRTYFTGEILRPASRSEANISAKSKFNGAFRMLSCCAGYGDGHDGDCDPKSEITVIVDGIPARKA